MKNLLIDNRTRLIGIRNNKEEVNYFIQTPTNEMIYAFTRDFSLKEWDICKSGIRIDDLFTKKRRHEGVMNLVKHAKYIVPYLCQEYDLLIAWTVDMRRSDVRETTLTNSFKAKSSI